MPINQSTARRLRPTLATRRESRATEFEREALSHRPELFAVAMRYARDERDAEDLVQETMLRAFAAWHRFETGTNCRAWLFRILTNSFISQCRRATKERRWIGGGEPIVSPARRRAASDPEAVIIERALSDEVVAALEELPDGFRRVVELADLEGLSYREIAQRIGRPIGTVMSRLHRGRRQLHAVLGDYAREQGILRAA